MMFTKSGLMVGLGETNDEVFQVMDDQRAADVDFLTIGQYLQPTKKHHTVERFVPPEEFDMFKRQGQGKGFLLVAASPLTRSSHHAGDDFHGCGRHADAASGGKAGAVMKVHSEQRSCPCRTSELVSDVASTPGSCPVHRCAHPREAKTSTADR